MQAGLNDFDMMECENSHIFCSDHRLEDADGYEEDSYCDDWPAISCPICQLQSIRDQDLVKFLLYLTDKTRKEVETEIRTSFKDLVRIAATLCWLIGSLNI